MEPFECSMFVNKCDTERVALSGNQRAQADTDRFQCKSEVEEHHSTMATANDWIKQEHDAIDEKLQTKPIVSQSCYTVTFEPKCIPVKWEPTSPNRDLPVEGPSSPCTSDAYAVPNIGDEVKASQRDIHVMEKFIHNDWSEAGPWDSKSDDGEQRKEVPLKKIRQVCSWIFVNKFENATQAQEALNKENTWSVQYSNVSEEGKKTYYRCNKVKKRASQQCSAKKYLLYDSTSDAVFMYKTEAGHDHEHKVASQHGIPEVVKLEINKLVDFHLKPRAILTALAKIEGIQVPKMTQLRNYLSDRRGRLHENHTISVGELKRWLVDNSVLPEDAHQTFVIAYQIPEGAASFRFVLSTKHLLGLARDVNIVHADATNKLTWQGYPVFVVGTTDKRRKFHALCLAVSTTEQKDDFQLIFRSMKYQIHSLFSSAFRPTVLVADAARSIQDAFIKEFDKATIRVCWAHAKRKMRSRIESDTKVSIQKQMLADVDTLHSITNQNDFNKASELFLEKYNDQCTFMEYFKEHWLVQNRNWYLGAAPASPSTNNALEAFIKVIRDGNTIRERLQLSRFLVLIKEMVNEWSSKYITNPEENFIAESPIISLKDWTDSCDWAKLSKQITCRDDGNFTRYQVPGAETNELIVLERPPENFDDFKEQYFSKWEVVLPTNEKEWTRGTCTCPTFFETFMCKHVIGMAIRLKYAVPPVVAENVPLPQKRKRGRPPKTSLL